ncbi:DUF2637 domain-containing protein [Kitasatospora sp. NPDC057965]|uniref:DUF2637 domain-containing protein n=1 Tax=Kitasatospora sp. NPDC057965 TaxID=3346291 RepID=UPI0036D924B4
MSTTATTTPTTAHVTGWDRAVVIALGAAGCALSYDALQQMAVAVHVREPLSYLFPLIIDGFVGYGVRTLLVLRDAPLRARAYVWLLFGAATGASLWANALHAIRLNQLHAGDGGLRLGDTVVVAVLSTIAPLALAGAVHLYILIARSPVTPVDRSDEVTDFGQAAARASHPGQTDTLTAGQSGQPVNLVKLRRPPVPVAEVSSSGLRGQPVTAWPDGDRAAAGQPVSPSAVTVVTSSDLRGQSVSVRPVSDGSAGDRRADPDTEELLAIAREAVAAEDNKLTRKVVAQAIRSQQIPLSSATLTQLMAQLRNPDAQPVTVDRT